MTGEQIIIEISMIISKHLPALQILIPFFAALLSVISFNRFAAWLISTICATLCLSLAIYAMPFAKGGISYAFGSWHPPIGIEYRLDLFNQPIIVFINAILLFFLLFGRELIDSTVTKYIEKNRQHIFYSLLLFAHVGYLGVISTNDLFNLYVFIEISSLATYVLMSKGNTRMALVGSFDYLMLGTIGATLILIGIGFLLAITGSLNITDIARILKVQGNSRLITTAIVFFLSGAILKTAFFPMHFWMIRAYSSAPPFILTYFAAISSIFGVYIILRFIHFTIDVELIQNILISVLRPMAMLTIAVCTFFAFKAGSLKKTIIYGAASGIGYIFLLMTILPATELLFQLLILDSINKIALFTIVAHIQNKTDDLRFQNFKFIEQSQFFKLLVAFALIFSAGLPMTSMFLVKIKLFTLLISQNLILEFIVVVLGSIFGLLYHFKLIKAIFFSPQKNGTIKIDTKLYGLMAVIMVQFISLLYVNDLASLLNILNLVPKINLYTIL